MKCLKCDDGKYRVKSVMNQPSRISCDSCGHEMQAGDLVSHVTDDTAIMVIVSIDGASRQFLSASWMDGKRQYHSSTFKLLELKARSAQMRSANEVNK